MIKVLFETKLTDVKDEDIEGVGTIRYEDNGRIFRWVKNHASTVIVAKAPVCYDVGSVGTKALYGSVETPIAGDLMIPAGVCVTALAISGGICYGWVQVQGYFKDARVGSPATSSGLSAAIAIGAILAPIDAVTFLGHAVVVGTAPEYAFHYVALETLAAATPSVTNAKDVYIKCF